MTTTRLAVNSPCLFMLTANHHDYKCSLPSPLPKVISVHKNRIATGNHI
jgi:hypothetical protein